MKNRTEHNLQFSRSITWISGIVALLATIAVPGIYLYLALCYKHESVQMTVDNAAGRVSAIITANPEAWTSASDHLDSVLKDDHGSRPYSYRLVSAEGKVVLNHGVLQTHHYLEASASLRNGSSVVGEILYQEDIIAVWQGTGIAGLLGLIMGIAIYFALRIFPLRAIARATLELKQANLTVVALNDVLEQRVESRTAELRQAQQELIKGERLAALGQLTATVSHELRNPLGALRASLYTIERRIAETELGLERAFGRANRSILRCDNIITEMLDFARGTNVAAKEGPIDDWLDTLLAEQEIPQGIVVSREVRTPDAVIAFDGERLRRAVINIFENGCHAIADTMEDEEDGTRKFTIGVSSGIAGDRYEMCFSDSGKGMTQETMDKIFEPLFSTKSFGTGLGMPTVRQIMELHGGGVEIESEIDKGTSVTLWLPVESPYASEKAA